ncbi:hypothetical protein SAMN05216480_11228 [Pustulibacterium marinum]|uniref:Lipocalin-like domain-containing protein n=1 Tax=Pustulibacterium marinum TaxID=1224947 RepID=A0A1I7I093_9FLAO|nr:hypothetical protein [Pustulibacterium marinum]SFU66384.1 hypothetical protein SAMN05216480_11228 [Pustulibacterium marinum]
MKTKILLVFSFILLFSCKDKEDEVMLCCDVPIEGLEGSWKLIQIFSDPGDGSGSWNNVESDKTLSFSDANDMVSSNGSVCNVTMDTDESSSANFVFSPEDETNTYGTITLSNTNCTSAEELNITYNFENSETLTLYYPCIEACGARYVKIDE